MLIKGLKYNQANLTFLQWRDSKQVYGLNFQNKEDAETFTQMLKQSVDNLNRSWWSNLLLLLLFNFKSDLSWIYY